MSEKIFGDAIFLGDVVAGKPLETLTALTVPVDHTNGKDPPAGMVFRQQDHLDEWLTEEGVTALKTLEAAWNATPLYVGHPILFELVAGVHRPPEAGRQGGFLLEGKVLSTNAADVIVRGAEPSSWTVVQAAAAITAYSNTGYNPYMDFAASTFPNDGSLKGMFVLTDAGQVTIIHDHSDSRLEVIHQLSPAPTTATIVKPSTILRNSVDDVNQAGYVAGVYARNNGVRAFAPVAFENILFEGFAAYYAALIDGSSGRYTQSMVDCPGEYATHSVALTNQGGMGGFFEYASQFTCSSRGFRMVSGQNSNGLAWPCLQYGYTNGCYFNGFSSGNTATNRLVLQMGNTIWENMKNRALLFDLGATWQPQEFGSNRRNTIRGKGVVLRHNSRMWMNNYCKLWFEQVEGPCIKVGDRCAVVSGEDTGNDVANGPLGGNDDVGIELTPSAFFSSVSLRGTVTANGSVGDVRMPDGTLKTYAEVTAGAVIDQATQSGIRKL